VVWDQGDIIVALTIAEFNGMVADHGPAMYRLAYRLVGDRHEAEDLVQEAFRSAWKSRNLFHPDGSSRAWLSSILRRRVADHWRRPRPPALVADDQRLETELAAEDPCRDELTDEMQHALDRLPAELKETLILVVVAELTHQEAAEVLGVPLGTVLSRVSRARNRLREYLTPTQNTESEDRTRNNINTTK
jgi:RNA polymerase sigma-70 factor (ECF subfamily)